MKRLVIIGAGPAGLTAAYGLSLLGHKPVVIEQSNIVGGLAKTEHYKGYHFDMGGHRFYTKSLQVRAIWQRLLGEDFLTRPRLSRIYYRGKFFDYPLKPMNAITGLGPVEGMRILLSYLRWKALPHRIEDTFEHWVTNRFGKRLFQVFFRSYTEKVWGISCSELSAEWAEQRIKTLSLSKALMHMFFKSRHEVQTLIQQFHYPRLGPGMLWSRVCDYIEDRGGKVHLSSPVVAVRRNGWRVKSVVVERNGKRETYAGTDFISSMPVTTLIKRLQPRPPQALLNAAKKLKYRDFLTVCVIVKQRHVFKDNWIYVHEPDVQVARIQNFKNWSPDMTPDPDKTSLGLEYFCQEGDALWNRTDAELITQAAHELETIGLAKADDVEDGCVFRIPQAYPVYDSRYQRALAAIKEYLYQFENLQTIGRNGLHRYNNQDHAMLTGIAAVRNALFAEGIDLWSINADHDYLEEICESDPTAHQKWQSFQLPSFERGDERTVGGP